MSRDPWVMFYLILKLWNCDLIVEQSLSTAASEMGDLPNSFSHSLSIQSTGILRKERVGWTILATFIAAIGPVTFGYCVGYSSSALLDLQNENAPSDVRLSSEQASWFSVSSMALFYNDIINRKIIMLILREILTTASKVFAIFNFFSFSINVILNTAWSYFSIWAVRRYSWRVKNKN